MYLYLHADHHFGKRPTVRLLWWFDIVELLNHYREEFNWAYVVQMARKYEVAGIIHRVLHMDREDLNARIPMDVLGQFEMMVSPYLPAIYYIPVRHQQADTSHHLFQALLQDMASREYMMRRYLSEIQAGSISTILFV